ncbi:hypothetical protein ACHQM5_009967 [Ranunculus cassubicifolius]
MKEEERDPGSSMETDIFLLQEEDDFITNTVTLDLASSPAFLNPTKHESHTDAAISDQIKRRKKRGGYNLRKSLAWNNAFFTEQGVLNQQELSLLSGHQNKFKEEFLSGIPEEGTNLLQNNADSSDSSLQHLEEKSFHTSPLRLSKRDPKASRELAKAFQTFSQAGGCPRPLASTSEKKLPGINSRNVLTKDVKPPKFAASKPLSYISTVPKIAAVDAKHSSCNRSRPDGSLEKQDFPKGLSNTSKNSFGCISSMTRSSGKDVASKATSGPKVIPAPLPTIDASSSKIGVPLPQSAQCSGQRFTNTQTFALKPSGLRPPSPSLRYFSQPQASTSLGVKSSGDTISCNLHEASIPKLRPLHEIARTVTMPGLGINVSNCSTSSATTTTMHPSLKFNNGSKTKVAETLQATPRANSATDIYDACGADNMTEYQQLKELTQSKIVVDIDNRKAVSSKVQKSEEDMDSKLNPCDLENIEHRENDVLQKNGARLLYSVKDNDIDGSKNSIFSEETEASVSSNISNSDGNMKCKLENTIHHLHKDRHHGNSIDNFSESRETNARGLKISQASSPAPVSCGEGKCGVSGSDYLSEDMNTKHVEDFVDDIESRKLEVHNDCLQVHDDDAGTLSWEQKEMNQQENSQHDGDVNNIPIYKMSGLIQDQDRICEECPEDNNLVKKKNVSCNKTEIESMDSAGENKCDKEKYELMQKDTGAVIQLKQEALSESRLKHKVNAAPFSDEWVAALEEVGEEILTMKTGAVQNSPPDKPSPELGPWSPVKRKNTSEIGPFDCTKYTTTTQTNQIYP